MSQLNDLSDLLHHQLKDLYSAETQLIDALPEMKSEASNSDLKEAFADHLEESKTHKERLEQIGNILDFDLKGETCKAMEGLIKEAKSFISEDASEHVRDAGIIADAQRVEHYEISAYGTAIQFAQALGHNEVVSLLQQTQDEESNADEILNNLAVDNINRQAKAAE